MAKPRRPSPGMDEYPYWQERLESRIASDLSIDDFCETEGVSRSTFYRWARRLKDGIHAIITENYITASSRPGFYNIQLSAYVILYRHSGF